METKKIYDFKIKTTSGGILDFSEFKGKTIILTNIATKCGFTPQLDDLEKLNIEYHDKGLEVIGIPSDDFGGQTPEDDSGVESFCSLNYGVTFKLTEKVKIKGQEKNDLIQFLENSRGGMLKGIKWNFEKFIFDQNGNYVDSFRSLTKPSSSKFKNSLGLE
jgi:glutathione peroxidase